MGRTLCPADKSHADTHSILFEPDGQDPIFLNGYLYCGDCERVYKEETVETYALVKSRKWTWGDRIVQPEGA